MKIWIFTRLNDAAVERRIETELLSRGHQVKLLHPAALQVVISESLTTKLYLQGEA
ncbi:MAG: hypothetical protein KDD62_06945 [Bdellovibrionales bacterium]|nr:hypothetical protein [Bdellovibrionales bacterium]